MECDFSNPRKLVQVQWESWDSEILHKWRTRNANGALPEYGTKDVYALKGRPALVVKMRFLKELSLNGMAFSENGAWPRARIRAIALAGLAAFGIYLCYRLAQPCIPSKQRFNLIFRCKRVST